MTEEEEAAVDNEHYIKMERELYRLRSDNHALKIYLERLQLSLKALVNLQYSIDHIDPNIDMFDLINKILISALDAVDSENGSLMLADIPARELVFIEVIGGTRERLLNHRIPINKGIVGWSIESRKVRLVENVNKDPLFSAIVDQKTGLKTDTLICVPLFDGDRPLGAIEAINTRSGRSFDESDQEVFEVVGRLASVALIEAEKASDT